MVSHMIYLSLSFKVTCILKIIKMVYSGVLHSHMSYGDDVAEYTKPIV